MRLSCYQLSGYGCFWSFGDAKKRLKWQIRINFARGVVKLTSPLLVMTDESWYGGHASFFLDLNRDAVIFS